MVNEAGCGLALPLLSPFSKGGWGIFQLVIGYWSSVTYHFSHQKPTAPRRASGDVAPLLQSPSAKGGGAPSPVRRGIFSASTDVPATGAAITACRCEWHLRRPRGYTLIELLVVITIMGIIAGVAIPKVIGSLYSGKQRSEAFQLVTAIRYAQGMAALQRAPYRLHFDLDNQSYYLSRDQSRSDEFDLNADTLGSMGSLTPPMAEEAAGDGDEDGNNDAGFSAAGRVALFEHDSHQLPTGVSIERIIDGWDEEFVSGTHELILDPKGTSSGARIYLVAERRNSPRYVIRVGANGLCRLTRDTQRRTK